MNEEEHNGQFKCPSCHIDLKDGGITEVETGVTNFNYYKYIKQDKTWFIDDSFTGDCSSSELECSICHKLLPDSMQSIISESH